MSWWSWLALQKLDTKCAVWDIWSDKKNREFDIVMSEQFHTLAIFFFSIHCRAQVAFVPLCLSSYWYFIFDIFQVAVGLHVAGVSLWVDFLPLPKTSQLERSSVKACWTDLSFKFYFFFQLKKEQSSVKACGTDLSFKFYFLIKKSSVKAWTDLKMVKLHLHHNEEIHITNMPKLIFVFDL